ncbi:Protein N-terminal amidase [Lachnellula suecica]|uniref:Protein N-terminal amidase n=1 Tax=Lachnellula suecica TaxID=602035 RepID=A0A8T9CDG8_9HELO|nr:Protein N-terminal amidase [Lachnellula suecica]
MRIAWLQFAPQVGDVDNNLNRADAVLSKANPHDLDLLVLPELAFSGYNFKSLQHISPYLEPTTAGITSLWARTTALKYECVVTAGYPEKVDISPKWPASPECYNSAITVNADGETIANYRKSFLYYTDETWALEGPDGFFDGEIDELGNVAMGICKWPTKSFERDEPALLSNFDALLTLSSPYKFESPWSAWEFAYHILHKQANLVVLSMAWLTREDARSYSRAPKEPDMDTLSYWLGRLEPLIRAETNGEIIVVFANRCGTEGEATYTGTSAVLGIQAGEVKVYGILGRGEKELLVVDTDQRPQAKLISQPNSIASGAPTEDKNFEKLKGTKGKEPAVRKPEPSEATNSTVSEKSIDTLSSKLRVATRHTDLTSTHSQSPDSALDPYFTMDDVMSPLSPVDPTSPTSFFAPKGRRHEGETLRDNLKSSIGNPDFHKETKLDSPTFVRPPSPKSRNASRTRQIIDVEPRKPALISHDLASEPQITAPSRTGMKAPPNSASAVPDHVESAFPPLGRRRTLSLSPRPRSTVW